MRTKSRNPFSTIRTEGGLLPAEFLQRVAQGDKGIDGLTPEAYHLAGNLKLNEAINRSWNVLLGAWEKFKTESEKVAPLDTGTSVTREAWLLPLFQELGYGRLQTSKAVEIEEKSYPVSHAWTHLPIHLVGLNVELDRRSAGVAGAARMSPHGLVQEFLNRSEDCLWAMLSNGHRLRILRDNVSLTRQAYVEFDLYAMMEGEVYSDFVVFWLVCHQSRIEAERPENCLLERWMQVAAKLGTRALEHLRDGVERAIETLGAGFVGHSDNRDLKDKLRSGELNKQDLYRQVLRTVYRIIFLFVAEDRELLYPPDADPEAKRRYQRYYSTRRLRELAERKAGTKHGDLWQMLVLVFRALGDDTGCPELALPCLGSFLWSQSATADLNDNSITNRDLLDAIRHLAVTEDGNVRRVVDYRNLGSEELGSIYESLLEMHPDVNVDAGTFDLNVAAGNERKTTGSYYTHSSLVNCLLDSALEPVITDRLKESTKSGARHDELRRAQEKALLGVSVCDPACGSGHFLIAAAHRIAKRLAAIRTGDEEPAPSDVQHALRDVAGHCLYGVDANSMAVELCKVSLWMEALEPGKPLSFLDHRIRLGNSLIGTEPELVANGLPDDAFAAVEGDDRKACTALRKRNKGEREGIGGLFVREDRFNAEALKQAAVVLDELPDETPKDIARKEQAFHEGERAYDYQTQLQLFDTWCAAFFIPKIFEPNSTTPVGITQRHIADLSQGRGLPAALARSVRDLSARHCFFHWPLAFPEVFAKGGFDLIIGNPPWDTLSPDQREFFGQYHDGMRSLSPSEQKPVIAGLLEDGAIAEAWTDHCRDLYTAVHFMKNSGRYKLFAPGNLGKGDFNVYRMFVELALRNTKAGGCAAQIVPAGFYGGANASAIRMHVFENTSLVLLVGCENKGQSFFPGVHPQTWFALYVTRVGGNTDQFNLAFGVTSPEEVHEAVRNAMPLSGALIRSMSPETFTIPDFRDQSDLLIIKKMISSCPAFGEESAGQPYRHYQREIDMGNDRGLFTTDPAGLPVYEGRMISHFDHRAKTYESGHGNSAVWVQREFGDPEKAIVPQWRVLRGDIPAKLGGRVDRYRIGFGDIANPRNERSFIASLVPPAVVCGHTVPTILVGEDLEWVYLPWLAVACSFTMDAFARRKLSSPHMTYSIMDSLPFPRPDLDDEFVQAVAPIVLSLVCTAPEMAAYFNAMARLGFCQAVPENTVPPSALLDPKARAFARAELDAIVARDVFGLTHDEISGILDTFPVLAKRDQKAYGEFRAKRLILDAYEKKEPAPRRPSRTVSVTYPSSGADKVLCSVALQLVKRTGGIDAADLTHALLFTVHPDRAAVLLGLTVAQMHAGRITPAKGAALNAQRLRSSMERRGALAVERELTGQRVVPGPEIDDTLIWLGTSVGDWPDYAIKAAAAYADLATDRMKATPEQKTVISDEGADFATLAEVWEVVNA